MINNQRGAELVMTGADAVGAFNSYSKPMSRHFYRLIYFWHTFSFEKERQFRSGDAVIGHGTPMGVSFQGNSI